MTGPAFVSYLGSNTVAAAHEIGDRLTAELGVDLRFAPADAWADVETAIDTGAARLFWLCGLVTVERVDAGRLDAEIVAAPVFPGEPAAIYRSVVIARTDGGAQTLDDLAGACLAVNDRGSWSGYHALRAWFAEAGRFDPFFGSIIETGSHAASIETVLAGDADAAAIDSTIWADRAARDERLRDLTIVAQTADRPAPPFAVSRALEPDLRAAIRATLIRTAPIGLDAIVPASGADYDPIRQGMVLARDVAW